MLSLPSLGDLDQGLRVRVFLCTSPTDMRKGFDTLAVLVRDGLGYDPLSGHLFLFVGRRRDRLKLLYWDRDGYAIWATHCPRDTGSHSSLRVASSERRAFSRHVHVQTRRAHCALPQS